ncbi:hypothetical protein LSTR_LSTR014394 [Laodelphax striatellus]|uniref:Uncharacterized protein n=1 Tax=Laodelphax striatellus TaxID=195883 RepID=A0A482XJ54_LAOST|nr:hypothetical protein LSTR_LSTR014394 [Laodelphax striatellus]
MYRLASRSIESDKLQGDWHALAGRNRCSQRSAIMEKREGREEVGASRSKSLTTLLARRPDTISAFGRPHAVNIKRAPRPPLG